MTDVNTPLHAEMASRFASEAEKNEDFTTLVGSVLREISYRPNYHFDTGYEGGRWWIEIVHERFDAITRVWGEGRGGKRWLVRGMSRSDITRMVFGALLAYEEHEVREFFRYRGQQVFGPHMDIDALATWLRETN